MPKMEWSGERLYRSVLNEVTIEHLHRYAMVLGVIKDKQVLDIACGDGYGSNLMSGHAKSVIGIDISQDTISSANLKYAHPNLKFIQGDACSIPLPDNSIDVIVSFETLEHHDRHDEMLLEIKRVLNQDGLLVISTPDRSITETWVGFSNAFHVKELYSHEFKALIKKYFSHARYCKQKIVVGSMIVPEQMTDGFTTYGGDFYTINSSDGLEASLFNICYASNGDCPNLKCSYFDGRQVIEKTFMRNITASKYYYYGYLLLSPFVKVRNFVKNFLKR